MPLLAPRHDPCNKFARFEAKARDKVSFALRGIMMSLEQRRPFEMTRGDAISRSTAYYNVIHALPVSLRLVRYTLRLERCGKKSDSRNDYGANGRRLRNLCIAFSNICGLGHSSLPREYPNRGTRRLIAKYY